MTITPKFLDTVWSKQAQGSITFVGISGDRHQWTWLVDETMKTSKLIPTDEDVFFCPSAFRGTERTRDRAYPGRWLFADLDESNPYDWDDDKPSPSIYWETSPGRFQALWLLTEHIPTKQLEDLNQRLTYFVGADQGGWSVTKMLRVPGSISTKHEEPFTVRIVGVNKVAYDPKDLDFDLPLMNTYKSAGVGALPDMPKKWPTMAQARRGLTPQLRMMLGTKTVLEGEDRSDKLWEIELRLAEHGVPPENAVVLLKSSVYNKFRGRAKEDEQFWTEYHKAMVATETVLTQHQPKTLDERIMDKYKEIKDAEEDEEYEFVDETEEIKSKLVTYRDFLTTSHKQASWLIEGIWGEGAHGLMGGEAKTFKTLLLLEIAVSVASGTPFLGMFPVPRVGPVIIIQEENDPGDLQDRLMRIGHARGVSPMVTYGDTPGETVLDSGPDLPIHFLNNEGFSLADDSWMTWLESEIKRIRPALVVFDPLYLLTPGLDENAAAEMTPILAKLLRLKQRYGCGTMVVHHFKKRQSDDKKGRSAARFSGTGVFHRWLASAIYVDRVSDDEPVIKITGEQRSHGTHGGYRVAFNLGKPDDLVYSAELTPWEDDQTEEEAQTTEKVVRRKPKMSKEAQELAKINDAIHALGGKGTVAQVAAEVGMTPNALRSAAKRLKVPTGRTASGTMTLVKSATVGA